jgi:NADH-quinone oxidoreductase subunit H
VDILAPVQEWLGPVWILIWTLIKIVAIAIPLIISVAYLTLAERKVIGYMQVRIGPNRVGPFGLLQPFADVFKLLHKEIIVPSGANRYLFFVAPLLSIGPALAAWAVIPFTDTLVLSNINAGLLYVLALTSVGVYGIILAGWASNSKYAFPARSGPPRRSCRTGNRDGVCAGRVLMCANSLNLSRSCAGAGRRRRVWYVWPLFPLFIVYLRVRARRDQPAPVRHGRRRIGDRGRIPRRVFGRGIRRFLPRRIHEHDPDLGADVVMFLGGWLAHRGR